MKKKIKNFTRSIAAYPSYTADLWKSNAKQYYLSVALHYIDDDWLLHCLLICCEHVLGPHSKDIIGKLVAEKLTPFLGENAKVHSGVTDGGEIASVGYTNIELRNTNNSFMKKVEPRLCVCHKLNNSIKRLLKDFFGTSYIEKWRAFIAHLNFSDPFNQLFEKCKVQIFTFTGDNLKSRPQKDTETRWSSTALMLKKACKFKDVVALMIVHGTTEQKQFIPHWDKDHWDFLQKLNDLLEPSVDMIKVMEGDKYPTQNLILAAIYFITTRLNEIKQKMILEKQQLELFYKVVLGFESEIDNFWNGMPQETLIAACLDPRHVREVEHEEAWACLKAEYHCPEFFSKHNEVMEEKQV